MKTNDGFSRGSISAAGLATHAMLSAGLMATVLAASGCGEVRPDAAGDAGSDAAAPDAATCERNTTTCSDDTETTCGPDGLVSETKSCPLGCSDSGETCADIVPSNNMGQYLHDAESGPELELPAGTVIHTGAGTVLVNDSLVTVPSVMVEAPLFGVDVRVFLVASLEVTGAVSIEGEAAVAFVSAGDIVIQGGHLSVDARGQQSGPGAGPDGDGVGGVCVPNACRGNGGGGFGGRGGNGGSVGGSAGGAGGAAVGNEMLVPLRGGGRGASGGGGGGSLQLVSRTNITITGGGVVSASGAGYLLNQVGGGGAGGGLLLEAPLVLVSGAGSALAANGGGGGCISPSQSAENGRYDDQRARGCASSSASENGAGGAGGAGLANSAGIAGSAGSINGGGGGGGAGRIRINTRAAGFVVTNGAIVSPQASTGTLPVR